MNDLITNIIYVIVTAVILPLITLIGKGIVNRIALKTHSDKCSNILNIATESVINAVKATAQTYVEALKKENSFDQEAQKIALEMCKETAKMQLSNEIKEFMNKNCGDFDKWLEIHIESTINTLKNKIIK